MQRRSQALKVPVLMPWAKGVLPHHLACMASCAEEGIHTFMKCRCSVEWSAAHVISLLVSAQHANVHCSGVPCLHMPQAAAQAC